MWVEMSSRVSLRLGQEVEVSLPVTTDVEVEK